MVRNIDTAFYNVKGNRTLFFDLVLEMTRIGLVEVDVLAGVRS